MITTLVWPGVWLALLAVWTAWAFNWLVRLRNQVRARRGPTSTCNSCAGTIWCRHWSTPTACKSSSMPPGSSSGAGGGR
jgi:hypothetical protein